MAEKDKQKAFVKQVRDHPYLKPACIQNETGKNAIKTGVFWQAMGKMKGFSDLIVFDFMKKTLYFVEMKDWKQYGGVKGQTIGRTKQSEEQIEFQKMVEGLGFKYFLIDDDEKVNQFFSEVG